MDVAAVASRMEELRRKRGIKMVDFLNETGQSRAGYYRSLSGEGRMIKREVIVKAAHIFEVDEDYILGISETENSESFKTVKKAVINYIRNHNFTDEQLLDIYEMAKKAVESSKNTNVK